MLLSLLNVNTSEALNHSTYNATNNGFPLLVRAVNLCHSDLEIAAQAENPCPPE
jgi:hypothetical protein